MARFHRAEGDASSNDVEGNETPKLGANVKVRNLFIRHSQKQSGEVFNASQTGVSTSSISEGGAQRAEAFGETIVPSQHGMKRNVSDSERTNETLSSIVKGVKQHSPTLETGHMRVKEELVAYGPPKFIALYQDMWNANKAKLLAERGLKLEDFSSLTPDEQEHIAEEAEEPVVREWLDNPDSELARAPRPATPPPGLPFYLGATMSGWLRSSPAVPKLITPTQPTKQLLNRFWFPAPSLIRKPGNRLLN